MTSNDRELSVEELCSVSGGHRIYLVSKIINPLLDFADRAEIHHPDISSKGPLKP
jgi:hypothetical protein